MKLKLMFVNTYKTTFKGQEYAIYEFIEPHSLIVISGTNLNLSFEKYKLYDCEVEYNPYKRNLKVISAS